VDFKGRLQGVDPKDFARTARARRNLGTARASTVPATIGWDNGDAPYFQKGAVPEQGGK
jgi:hypothetical protein